MKRVCVLFFLLGACITTRAQPGDVLMAGSGGGFTGMVNAYKIFVDGKVYRGKGVTEVQYTECATLRKAKARKLIRRAAQAVSDVGEFNAPGNQYYFLTAIQQGKETKVTWGAADRPVPDVLKNLYQEVQEMVAGLKYRPIP
jgi:hypothetical protein